MNSRPCSRGCSSGRPSRSGELAASLRGRGVLFVFVAARGTSDNAALYAKYLWGAGNGLPVALAAPSLFTSYGRPPALRGALVVAISQSGQSPDIVAVLDEARRQGAPTLAIVNEAASPLARAADAVIDVCAGPELAVAATKTYTAQLMAIAMLSAALAGDEARWRELARVPDTRRAGARPRRGDRRVRRALPLHAALCRARAAATTTRRRSSGR